MEFTYNEYKKLQPITHHLHQHVCKRNIVCLPPKNLHSDFKRALSFNPPLVCKAKGKTHEQMKIRRQLNKYQENKSGLYRLRKHFSQLYLKPFERARKHINSFEHILTSPKCFCHNSSLKALRETTVIRSEKILIFFSKSLSTY